MIISIFACLFDTGMEGWHYKNQVDADDDNDDKAVLPQKFGSLACTIGTLIATVVTFVFISRGKDFFRGMRDSNCSDPQTNDTIGFIAKTAIEIFDIWIGKLVLDVLKIFFYLFVIYRTYQKRFDDKDDLEMKS